MNALKYLEPFEKVRVYKQYFKDNKWQKGYIESVNYNPRGESIHHTLTTENGTYLFVLDIDGQNLEQSLEISERINRQCPSLYFFDKFSGNKGIHKMFWIENTSTFQAMLQRRKYSSVREYSKAIILDIIKNIKDERVGTVVGESEVIFDLQVHDSNHNIRSLYSVHEKTNLFSIPIYDGMTAEDIRTAAQYDQLSFNYKIQIPFLEHYHYGTSLCFPSLKSKDFTFKEIISTDPKIQLINQRLKHAQLCIQRLMTKEGKVGHYGRFWLSVWLYREGFDFDEILSFWKTILSEKEYLHFLVDEEKVMKTICSKNYHISCQKMKCSGYCIDGCKEVL